MSNFKSGSGNLDFGESSTDTDEEENTHPSDKTSTAQNEDPDDMESSSDHSSSASTARQASVTESTDQSASNRDATEESIESSTEVQQYPYFVRRSNVGDERDTRLEIHVRDKVADHEAEFRSELADSLGANEVSKTDAREFALLAAFQHPEQVAELMQDEGFGTFR